MKIMILVPSFGKSSPVEGAFLFAKYLKENSVDVIFASLDRKYNSKQNIKKRLVEHDIKYKCLNIKGWYGVFFKKNVLKKYILENNVPIVIAYLIRPTIACRSIKEIFKVAYVRGMLRQNYQSEFGGLLTRILIFLEMRALKKMDIVFSMTRDMKKWLLDEGLNQNKLFIINNSLDVEKTDVNNIVYNREKEENINIGIFCNLIPLKRVEDAIYAIHKIITEYSIRNIKLHIAGDGRSKDEMEIIVNNKLNMNNYVEFHGYLENPMPLMNKMNIVLLTSETEGIPRCIMEALSLGITVIASNIPGNRELIRDGETGYLFEVGDYNQLAYRIYDVINDKKYLSSKKLKEHIYKNFNIKNNGQKMFSIIKRIYYNMN